MDTEGVTCCASFFSTVMCTTGAAMPPMSLMGCVMFDYVFTVSELAGLVRKSWMPRAQPTGATPEERNASSTTHKGPRMRREIPEHGPRGIVPEERSAPSRAHGGARSGADPPRVQPMGGHASRADVPPSNWWWRPWFPFLRHTHQKSLVKDEKNWKRQNPVTMVHST